MNSVYDLSYAAWEERLMGLGYKPFHAGQLFRWVYQKHVRDVGLMSDLAKPLRAWLEDQVTVPRLPLIEHHTAADGTMKCLFELADGHAIETVLMRHSYGNSICVTSQVGCNMGCTFCASGLAKKVRNLTLAEMLLQIQGVIDLSQLKPTHVVIMGIGEPFDNYETVMDFIDTINHPHGYAIGKRHITVSTSGLAPQIEAFAEREKQVNLAISLHAPTDALRSSLMPINRKYSLKRLMQSVDTYLSLTSRRITFEYIMIKDVNDRDEDAEALIELVRGRRAYVNLIPYNPVSEFAYETSSKAQLKRFYDRLMQAGIQATTRKEKGDQVNAACGQLRLKKLKEATHEYSDVETRSKTEL